MQSDTIPDRPRASSYRWVICALLFWVTTANYIDRSVFGNLAPELQKVFHWTDQQYWYMTMCFQAAYAVSMLGWGRIVDGLGLRWGFVLAVAFWGLASMGHAFVTGLAGFFLVRILLGMSEGGNFPAAIKTVAEWFPKRERALATGLFNSGTNIGGTVVPIAVAFLVPVLAKIHIAGHSLGWRGAFLFTGLIDLAWIVAWLTWYRRPLDNPHVSADELAIINSEPPEATTKIAWSRLFGYRQTWAFAIAKSMTDCMWWFYLFGAPPFFAERFHLDAKQRALPVSIIYIVASIGSIGGGWLAGRFMKEGWTVNRARKITMLLCALCVVPVFYAALTTSVWVAVGLITLAASAHQAWSANAFSLAGDMFPRRVVGSVTGLGGFLGAAGGIFFSYYVGQILGAKGGAYFWIFLAPSVAYLLSLLIVHLLVPRLEPARIDVPAVP
jgi:ACS family hexuronate transporter-like MFS transporter